jgi:hypothetical protein
MNHHDAIRRSRLANHADKLIALLEPSARITVQDDESAAPVSISSHFGGVPLLPEVVAWPRWDKHDLLAAQIERAEESHFPRVPFTFSSEWTLPDSVLLEDDRHTIFTDEYLDRPRAYSTLKVPARRPLV